MIGTEHNNFENLHYSGNWEHGLRKGFGKMTWPDKSTYEGSWDNDLIQGMGKYTWSNNQIYIGLW